MEYPRSSLVVLTLLQLCRAQQIAPRWYSASDGFQPKPISELFTTETTFSSQKPIVVTQVNSVSGEPEYSSSPRPSSQYESAISQHFPTTPTMPAGALYQLHLTQLNPLEPIDILQQNYDPASPYIPKFQPIPNAQEVDQKLVTVMQPKTPPEVNVQPLEPKQTYTPGWPLTTLFEPQKTTNAQPQTQTTVYPPQTQYTVYQPQTQSPTSYSTAPPTYSTTPVTTFSTTSPTTLRSTPLTTFSTAPPTTFSTASPSTNNSPTLRPPNSNYILIYQQAPQSFQPFPPSPEVTIQQSTPTTVSLPPRTSEFSTTRPTTISTTTPMPTYIPNRSTDKTSTMSTSSVTVTPSSTFGLTKQPDCVKSTALPILPSGLSKKGAGLSYPLKIRVVAPSGSITNVNINPVKTTKKPVTSTTKRPTTRRTSKPKKNNYDRCLDGCRKVRDPICAAPLSHITIDAKTLKGFPSVCHMACHNSYRKEPFEKVIDGSCSKLRTRIRLIDSKSKLRRDELRKNEYSIDIDPKTVIEVTGLV